MTLFPERPEKCLLTPEKELTTDQSNGATQVQFSEPKSLSGLLTGIGERLPTGRGRPKAHPN